MAYTDRLSIGSATRAKDKSALERLKPGHDKRSIKRDTKTEAPKTSQKLWTILLLDDF